MTRRLAYDAAASLEARRSFVLGGRTYSSGETVPRDAAEPKLMRKLYDDWKVDVKGSPTAPGAPLAKPKVPEKRRQA